MPKDKNSYIFLAENRNENIDKNILIKRHSIAFGLDEIELDEIFLNPQKTLFFRDKSATVLTYIGDVFDENENLIKENSFTNSFLSISNPYKKEFVSIFSFYSIQNKSQFQKSFCLDIDKLKENSFSEAVDFTSNSSVRIGKFQGKNEVYINESGNFLAYVVEGACEIEGCLLEKGGALKLENIESLAVESLSNSALLIVFSNIY